MDNKVPPRVEAPGAWSDLERRPNMVRIQEETKGVKPGINFGRLTILGWCFRIKDNANNYVWCAVCQCECGKIQIKRLGHLRNGSTLSCGCIVKEKCIEKNGTHKLTKHPLYHVWTGIKYRCFYKGSENNKRYGGRGIQVCEEWIRDFQTFYNWAIIAGWKPKHDIDRIDNDGNYEPSNCHFVKRKINCRNKGNNHLVEAFGEIKTAMEWSEDGRCMVNYFNLMDRLNKHGWNPEKAIATPARKIRTCVVN